MYSADRLVGVGQFVGARRTPRPEAGRHAHEVNCGDHQRSRSRRSEASFKTAAAGLGDTVCYRKMGIAESTTVRSVTAEKWKQVSDTGWGSDSLKHLCLAAMDSLESWFAKGAIKTGKTNGEGRDDWPHTATDDDCIHIDVGMFQDVSLPPATVDALHYKQELALGVLHELFHAALHVDHPPGDETEPYTTWPYSELNSIQHDPSHPSPCIRW